MNDLILWSVLFGLGALLGAGIIYLGLKNAVAKREHFSKTSAQFEKDLLLNKLEAIEKHHAELVEHIKETQNHLQNEIEKRSKYECENSLLKQSIENTEKARVENMESWRAEIENRTNTFVAEKSKKFEQHLEERLLHPLRENIDKFKKDVQESFKENSKDQGRLQEMLDQKVKDMIKAKDGITSQAENLANVFKQDYKSQGDWGELLLEKILEDSGLKRDVHYRAQPTMQDEEGKTVRPDVVIDLPYNKHIIIDSKVSLVYCEKFCSEDDEEKKEGYRKHFIQNIKKQIDDLSSKHYQHAKGINSPDFVLMFIPIERAYSLLISCDENLHTYAWNKKRVALVSVSNVMATVSVINRILSMELQNKNVAKIVSEAQSLYDKFVTFLESMEQLGAGIERNGELFKKALHQLSSGRRDSLIGRIESLRDLGLNPTKSIQAIHDKKKAISPYLAEALQHLESNQ